MLDDGAPSLPRWLSGLFSVIWLPLLLTCLAVLAAGLPVYYRELSTACRQEECLYFQLNSQDITALGSLGLSASFYAGYKLGSILLVVFTSISLGVILRWKARTPLAALASVALVTTAPTFFPSLTEALVKQNSLWLMAVGVLQATGMWSIVVLAYLFPDSRFYPRWTRIFAALVGIPSVSLLFMSIPVMLRAENLGARVAFYILLAAMIAGMVAQVLRYRRDASLLEKQQIKWGLYGFSLLAFAETIFVLIPVLFNIFSRPGIGRIAYFLLGGSVNNFALLFLLFSIATAIFRYRLWDVDLLIRRTLLYGVLTATLLAIYFGGIITLQSLLSNFAGQANNSPVVIVVSTLVIAALFNPLRRRIQEGIDRRFYRQRYDAEQTLEHFAGSLRNEVDLEQISDSLLLVVQETMQPTNVSLWMKSADRKEIRMEKSAGR